jgi:uncharacterized protein with HEPN domain
MLRDKQALMDISNAIQQTLLYAQDIDRNNLQEDDEKQSAILYRLIILGEATKRLSNEFREQHPKIPWRQMAGLRDVVIHDYSTFRAVWIRGAGVKPLRGGVAPTPPVPNSCENRCMMS